LRATASWMVAWRGTQFLVGFALEQIQRAHLPAIQAGAKAHQEFARDAHQPRLGLGVHLDPPPIGQGQGLIPLQGPLGELTDPARRDGRQEGAMGLGEGREVVAGDLALVQEQREVGRSVLRAAWTKHPLQARTQGDDIRGMALLAAGVQGEPLLLIHHQGQGELAQVSALLLDRIGKFIFYLL
jgi:hypothetical protein